MNCPNCHTQFNMREEEKIYEYKIKDPAKWLDNHDFGIDDNIIVFWYEKIIIVECTNCKLINKMHFPKCIECDKYTNLDDVFNHICMSCISKKNPSTEFIIYKWKDGYWYIEQVKLVCKLCNQSRLIETKSARKDYFEECALCRANKLSKLYPTIEFYVESHNVYFKRLCKCGEICIFNEKSIKYLKDYDDKHIKYRDIVLNCKKCNPSTIFNTYLWQDDHWKLDKQNIKCNLCSNFLTKKYNESWSSITQCSSHEPANEHIKYTYTEKGWKIDKIKVFNGKKHIWKKATNETSSYTCQCNICKP